MLRWQVDTTVSGFFVSSRVVDVSSVAFSNISVSNVAADASCSAIEIEVPSSLLNLFSGVLTYLGLTQYLCCKSCCGVSVESTADRCSEVFSYNYKATVT